MRFHIPSFLYYLRNIIPYNVGFLHHHYVVYLVAYFPLRQDFLKDAVIQACIRMYETPIGTPDGPEQRSVIEGLLDQHRETLEQTLYDLNTYLKTLRKEPRQPGEKRKYEYRIDLLELQDLLRNIRLQEDLKLIGDLIQDDFFVSIRYLEKRLFQETGKAFSARRITESLKQLEQQGRILNNGHIRTYGREVIS